MRKSLVVDFDKAATAEQKQDVSDSFSFDYGIKVIFVRSSGQSLEIAYDDEDAWEDDFMVEEAEFYPGVANARVIPG